MTLPLLLTTGGLVPATREDTLEALSLLLPRDFAVFFIRYLCGRLRTWDNTLKTFLLCHASSNSSREEGSPPPASSKAQSDSYAP